MTRADGADAASVVARFNDAITRQDLDDLTALMTSDHVFVDSASSRVVGREACANAWRGFFAAFPDYRNHLATVRAQGDWVTMTGHSTCADSALAGPAVWTATVRGTQVSEWRVHDDTPSVRRGLGLPADG